MFHRILVPLDGSLLAERALPIAAQIARANQGMLILLHVGSVGGEQGPDRLPQLVLGETLLQNRVKRAQDYLAALASSRLFSGIALTTAVLSGPVVATIHTALCTYQADLLVLCEQVDPQEHASGLNGVARQALEHSNVPVLRIPEHGPSMFASLTNREQPITIFAAFDGPGPAHTLIAPATSLLAALDGKGRGQLRFVPIHASDPQSEEPSFNIQRIDLRNSSVGSETDRTNMASVLLKNPRERVQQKKEDWSDNVVFVQGTRMEAECSTGNSEKNQRYLLARRDHPVLFVPSLERG